MKNKLLILILLLSSAAFAFTLPTAYQDQKIGIDKDAKLCKLFQKKAHLYEKTMREDIYAKKTLESYQLRAELYCIKN
ncbi:hypothetical protein JHD48_01290 [Sulfurimonas sp. SAG-AH-194-I05]|nr:hypothetical protein [Sulfurimonas sp. SAG-AH-194-I05]MDF1874363.1 hypothetical protein [Sulfurimonas sp. SAG-AH-194-I05]